MKKEDIIELFKKPTTSIGALADTNYFSIEGENKKELKNWELSYYDDFDYDSLFNGQGKEEVTIPYIAELNHHGFPWYTNVVYPFKYTPPYIEGKIPSMVFIRNEIIEVKENKNYILELHGVCNCYSLLVNNRFAGFSNITHALKRFDITPFIKNGNNEIRLVVSKFSPSSYLEDQDKFRYSGVIRPIYLVERTKGAIETFVVKTKLVDDKGIVSFTSNKKVDVKLFGYGYESSVKKTNQLEFIISNPKLWNSEHPYLYEMDIIDGSDIIHQKVGIRDIKIKENIILLNNSIFKMKGVNHHSSTLNGDGESLAIFKKDIELFKKLNINAVRTSHYPADQRFLDLCDENGIYVISESDLETHGTVTQNGGYQVELFNDIIRRPEFKEQIKEREMNNVKTNINHPSILLWSFGNESGYHPVVDEICKEIKKIDNRPIHYEGTFNYEDNKSYFYSEGIDVYSRMYAPVEYCKDEIKSLDKPFMLCEYVHAMGNSCGELDDYVQTMFNQNNFFGAFVWEWTNHYVLEDGIEKYGGDFNEPYHDGSFCIDGLVTLDRCLSPKTRELKECYSPVEYMVRDGKIWVENRFDFTDLSECSFTLINTKGEKLVLAINLPPHEKAPLIETIDSDYYVITLFDKYQHELSKRSVIINRIKDKPLIDIDRTISFDLNDNGLLDKISVDGLPLLTNMQLVVSRPLTSNDSKYKDIYDNLKLNELKFITQLIEKNDFITVKGVLCHDVDNPFFYINLIYKLDRGVLNININATKVKEDFEPLRFGLLFELPNNYKTITYSGLDGESYSDRNKANIYGIHTILIEDNYRYIVPQSANDHYGTDYLVLDNNNVCITANKPFSFNYDCFKEKDYLRHRNEMKNTEKRYLILDYKTRGVGTDACGPKLANKYRITEKDINISFSIYCKK